MAGWRTTVAAVVGYASAAVVFTWPLGRCLTTHLPADPAGDAGVYAWNLWVFAREWGPAAATLTTNSVFPLTGGTDLALHNYTIASNLLALPLIDVVGVVAAFNVVFLIQLILAAFGVFQLARYLTNAPVPSWFAGLVFAFSPVLGARAAGHFSLVAVAPLPFFALAMLKALRQPDGRRWAFAAGACVAWAGSSDPYYAVYCLVILAVFAAGEALAVDPAGRPNARCAMAAAGGALGCGALGVAIRLTGGTEFGIGGHLVHVRTAYTPMLVACVCACVAVGCWLVPRVRRATTFQPGRVVAAVLTAGVTAAVLLSPVLRALIERALDGRWMSAGTLWRSSTPGLDLAALVLPNPAHPYWGAAFRGLLERWRPDAYPEFVGSLPLGALAAVLLARWRGGRWPDGSTLWCGVFVVSVLLSLGPFITIAGFNSQVPGPWSVLRFVPVLGWARAPSRFAVLSTMGLCILLAFALRDLVQSGSRGRTLAGVVAMWMLLETTSMPKPMFAASMPSILGVVAASQDAGVRVLHLPVGIRDGLESLGNAVPLAQFHQTRHGKSIIGGYLSRVSDKRRHASRSIPTLRALMTLSAGQPLSETDDIDGRVMARRFVSRGRIGFVIVDRARAPERLRSWAIEALDLELIGTDQGFDLFTCRTAHEDSKSNGLSAAKAVAQAYR